MQGKTVHSNAMDDMFVAFTVVQQIITGLSRAASEEEKVSIITKVFLAYSNIMAATVHRHLNVGAFNVNSTGRQFYEL
jgi:hypothetical protein